MLQYDDGTPFASSRTDYLDQIEGRTENRICILVRFAELPATLAIVDTGAPYSVLSRQQAIAYDPNYRSGKTEETTIQIGYNNVDGVLIRLPVFFMC